MTQTDRNPQRLSATPAEHRLRRLITASRQSWWCRELVLVGAFYGGYDVIRGFIGGGTAQAERNGRDLLRWEQVLHLDPEHWLNDHVQHLAALAVPACFFYATLHFIVTPAVLVWAYRYRPACYRQARTVLAVITATALIGFWLFPTAPPRLLTGAGFQDTLAHFSSWGWWGSDGSVPRGATAIANQYAAMPSLHLAWAAWCGATVFTLTRRYWVNAVAIAYPVLTALVVLGTANHYLLDVLAGIGLWLLATFAVSHPHRIRESAGNEPGWEPNEAVTAELSVGTPHWPNDPPLLSRPNLAPDRNTGL